MPQCPECRHRVSAFDALPDFCPKCGAMLASSEAGDGHTPVARLNNLAEVGYFADLLESQGFEPHVRQHDEFSALDGSWQTTYLLCVAARDASRAAGLLKEELQNSPDESNWEAAPFGADDQQVGSLSMWKPMALLLVAGGLAYIVGRDSFPRPPQQQPAKPRSGLWQAVDDTGQRTFYSTGAAGRTRLRFEADNRVFLDEDFDADGQYDRSREYRLHEPAG